MTLFIEILIGKNNVYIDWYVSGVYEKKCRWWETLKEDINTLS